MEEKLKKIISEYSDADLSGITRDSLILGDLGLSSITILSMIGAVEDEFDIEIDDAVLAEVKTVGDLLDVLGQDD